MARMTETIPEVSIAASPPFAHSLDGRPEGDWETLEAHSRCVAEAAARRAAPFGGDELARLAGLLHDLGKAKPRFQARLEDASIREPHAAEGARFAVETFGGMGRLLAFGIAGHHGGMPNALGRSGLDDRVEGAAELSLPAWVNGRPPVPPTMLGVAGLCHAQQAFRLQFLARMIYSCLVEADDRETARFYALAEGREPEREDRTLDASRLLAAFDHHMAALSGKGPVNALRREVLEHARRRAAEPPGLFSMTVPTGGGKTLASLGFALEHARAHGLRRLVYVIPFTSIVEQTAGVFRDVVGDDEVLEHHSTFDWEAEAAGDDDEVERLRRAAQSWDAPIVVTTAVQFFESLFANRKKRCRKLNALSGSVIVLDEAQTLPLKLLRPCLAALRELTSAYGASVVLCTATQPGLRREDGFPDCPQALEDVREIAPDPPQLYGVLKRARVRDVGRQDDAALAARMRKADRILTIVDNRTQARRLFDAITDAEGACHLSTLMTPAHRRHVLDDVRGRLDAGLPVRLSATSLVEAGVDVDFPMVMRAASGIDRVAQAAGRCNREGKMDRLGEVLVFRSEHKAPPELKQFAEIGERVLDRHDDDPLSPETVGAYFRELYATYGIEALDCAEVGSGPDRTVGILAEIEATARGLQFPFADIAAAFRIIEDGQRAVILRGGRWGMPEGEMARLTNRGPGALARGAQSYTINVPHAVWKGLWAAGAVSWWQPERFDEQFAVVEANEGGLYDDHAGLAVEGFEEAGFLQV